MSAVRHTLMRYVGGNAAAAIPGDLSIARFLSRASVWVGMSRQAHRSTSGVTRPPPSQMISALPTFLSFCYCSLSLLFSEFAFLIHNQLTHRSTSGVTRPPPLRMISASPMSSPRNCSGMSRLSMHVSTVSCGSRTHMSASACVGLSDRSARQRNPVTARWRCHL